MIVLRHMVRFATFLRAMICVLSLTPHRHPRLHSTQLGLPWAGWNLCVRAHGNSLRRNWSAPRV